MFSEEPELAPISMIITNLATQAYSGEPDIYLAVTGIVARMHEFVRPEYPRIPNPADPAEDYADKWRKIASLEDNFWIWLSQVKSDLAKLHALSRDGIEREARNIFSVNLNREQLSVIDSPATRSVATVTAIPSVYIPSAPKPWGRS